MHTINTINGIYKVFQGLKTGAVFTIPEVYLQTSVKKAGLYARIK